jgi:hypothetical protein
MAAMIVVVMVVAAAVIGVGVWASVPMGMDFGAMTVAVAAECGVVEGGIHAGHVRTGPRFLDRREFSGG